MICRLAVRGCCCRGMACGRVVGKGAWWMPWQTGPMKDAWGRDRPRGAADRALIRGCPNGVTRRLLWAGTAFVRGVRREVKHLSTCRKGYSVSSGERKRMMAKPVPCETRRGLRHGCCGTWRPGSDGPGGSDKAACEANGIEFPAVEGDGPVAEGAPPAGPCSQVARDSWNPV